MRCPDCNKFVSYDEPMIEVDSIDVNDDEISGNVRVVLACAECGEELKDCYFDISETIAHECDGIEEDGFNFEILEEDNFEPMDRYEDRDRNGKLIKNMRYMKHLYGFTGTIQVQCMHCNEVIDVEVSDEAAGSEFDELV